MVSVAISKWVDHFDEAGYCGPFKSTNLSFNWCGQMAYLSCNSMLLPLIYNLPPFIVSNKTPEIHGICWFRLATLCCNVSAEFMVADEKL